MKANFLIFFPVFILLFVQILNIIAFPSYQNMVMGEKLLPEFPVPQPVLKNISYHVSSSDANVQKVSFTPGDAITTGANAPEQLNMQVKLFGMVPIREIIVNLVPRVEVIPGGQSIGVLLHSHGVMVVGLAEVRAFSGKTLNPAEAGGIKTGDLILQADGVKIENDAQLSEIINKAGKNNKSINFKVKRNNKTFYTEVKPVYCNDTYSYRIGLFIRDTAAGVGTLTFYHPETGRYGALGHVISGIDSSQKINTGDGYIIEARVQGIHPGKKGEPGEKIGFFEEGSGLKGSISKNSKYGIFGDLEQPLENPYYKKPLPVALAAEVNEGPAQIFTVIDGEKIEKYNIEIQQVVPRAREDGKGLIIKITDERLLECTGGIIQGMSGSPIIQNERLAGAVTHVFINNPARGYGILGQWMIEEAGIFSRKSTLDKAS